MTQSLPDPIPIAQINSAEDRFHCVPWACKSLAARSCAARQAKVKELGPQPARMAGLSHCIECFDGAQVLMQLGGAPARQVCVFTKAKPFAKCTRTAEPGDTLCTFHRRSAGRDRKVAQTTYSSQANFGHPPVKARAKKPTPARAPAPPDEPTIPTFGDSLRVPLGRDLDDTPPPSATTSSSKEPTMPTLAPRPCKQCETPFTPKRSDGRFCSRKCLDRHNHQQKSGTQSPPGAPPRPPRRPPAVDTPTPGASLCSRGDGRAVYEGDLCMAHARAVKRLENQRAAGTFTNQHTPPKALPPAPPAAAPARPEAAPDPARPLHGRGFRSTGGASAPRAGLSIPTLGEPRCSRPGCRKMRDPEDVAGECFDHHRGRMSSAARIERQTALREASSSISLAEASEAAEIVRSIGLERARSAARDAEAVRLVTAIGWERARALAAGSAA